MILPHRHFGGEELTLEILIRNRLGIEQFDAGIVGAKLQHLAFFPTKTDKGLLRQDDDVVLADLLNGSLLNSTFCTHCLRPVVVF